MNNRLFYFVDDEGYIHTEDTETGEDLPMTPDQARLLGIIA